GTAQLEHYEGFDQLPPPDPPMTPPPDLARSLPRWWGISNVNWWPNFPTTAATAQEMYRRQGGGNVDGVVAITDNLMADIVGVLGPIQLPGYDQPVVEDGFSERVIYEVEVKVPQDVPQKKFLIELSKVIFDRVFNAG